MKQWRFLNDQEGRGRSSRDRSGRHVRPLVEPLDGRTLLSSAHGHVHAEAAKVPAAYKPPPQTKLTFPPYDISVEIHPDSDPGASGHIFQRNVLVDGYSVPYSSVWMAQGTKPGYFTNVTQADYTGHYAFLTPVPYGTTVIQVFAENSHQDYSRINRVTVTRGNAIVAWDSIALRAIRNQDLSAPEAARDLAILHAAQYDAVAATSSPTNAYQVHVTAPKGASPEAAADASAASVLESLFPTQNLIFQNAYNAAVAGMPTTKATSDGLAVGRQVSDQILANRSGDGSNVALTLAPSAVPGQWRPTPPGYLPATDPQFAQVTPFVISGPAAFRPAAPPVVGSASYNQAEAQVAAIGRSDSATRTADQTAAAQFWNGGPGSVTDPGHWNSIAEQISVTRKDTLVADARLFARLDFALADTAIASTDAQYAFDEWRPISAVQATDPTVDSLLLTPASPSYVSDQAAFGAAAADVLSATFGPNTHFTDTLYAATGVIRSFPSFTAAATEDASSRIWGGVNFAFDVQAGTALGDQVGKAVLASFPRSK